MAVRAVALVTLLAAVGCGADDPPRVTMRIATRDGEDPLEGAARLRVELEAEPTTTLEPMAVEPGGFELDFDLSSVDLLRRVRLFLDDADDVLVSRGSTPEAQLQLLSGLPLRVLVSRVGEAGSVTVEGMPALEAAAPLASEWIVGLDETGAFAILDLLGLTPFLGVQPLDPPRPGARVADLGEGRTLVVGGGEGVRLYDGQTGLWSLVGDDGIEEGAFATPAVLGREGGGALAACGGRREVVAFAANGTVEWVAELEAARTGCGLAVAGGALVVYGGGDGDAPAAEVVDLDDHAVRTLVADPDPRADAGAAGAGGRVLVAGGVRDGSALGDGLRLDPSCADGCPAPVALEVARAPAVAQNVDDDHVLVAGGGEPPELVALEDAASTAVRGPGSDAAAWSGRAPGTSGGAGRTGSASTPLEPGRWTSYNAEGSGLVDLVAVRKLERYELIEEIGHGGMAVVYRGRDSQLERAVAVKVLHPHLQSQPESKKRFHREAKAVARLRHPNIPEIYDYSGEGAEDSYIVTELIHGPTLKRFLELHPGMPPEIAAMVIIEVCRALEHAHGQGIIHRDVKPENVMIAADGVVKLTDFGIAQILDSHSMTVTGQILGSPAHMSPEHLEGKILDFRADVFSVGTVLYWLATGNLPFEGRNPHAVLKKIFDGDYPEPLRARPQMGEALAAIIRRCLALDPEQRYPTVTALRADLEAFLAELGLPDTSSLPAFFADPAGFCKRHEPEILARVVKTGAAALRAGDRAKATALFNRALAIDPQNADVLRQVRAMVRRRRTSLGAGLVALGALALLATWGVWPTSAERPRPSGRGSTSARGDADRDPAPAKTTGVLRAEPQARAIPADDRDPPAKARRAVLQQVGGTGGTVRVAGTGTGQRTVRFAAGRVGRFEIWVDGVRLGHYGPDLQTRTLDVGPHEFRFVGAEDCCQDAAWTEVVLEGEGEQRIHRTLSFRPALLNVETNVRADIEVAGRRGRNGALIEVPMTRYTERQRVVARANGYRTTEAFAELRVNETASIRITLEPEPAAPAIEPTGPEGAKLDSPL